MSDPQRRRPSLREVLTNLSQPMPLHTKLRLMARNYWIRVRDRTNCCGHDGEPGC